MKASHRPRQRHQAQAYGEQHRPADPLEAVRLYERQQRYGDGEGGRQREMETTGIVYNDRAGRDQDAGGQTDLPRANRFSKKVGCYNAAGAGQQRHREADDDVRPGEIK